MKPMQLRLPEGLKDWIKSEADKNASSQNSEVIRAIRERMDRTEQPTT
ncbi:Arc family DNA-binding protein [Sedimentitalea todarodis]|uniref:Arc family DNA-binding protein n=1 Tax=Sedimentitalea todarodis TaxID=1631240 RepID=A0ABU3VHR9_9RHOB|nr:Arc family DNA-binding protein [Sedimentitalea todarodis]MDU9005737.1 Arc family DNA-binding protein [Sedimentitalea todarodis]